MPGAAPTPVRRGSLGPQDHTRGNAASANDVEALRNAGFCDVQIFAIAVFVALRIAFSTVNDALGARPDRALGDTVPAAVRDAVPFGRHVAEYVRPQRQ